MVKRLIGAIAAASVTFAIMGATPLVAHASAPAPAPAECTITGTPRSDTLIGTPGDDVICGLGGNDKIFGGNGNDIIRGGDGRDSVDGGAGDDELSGDAGNDSLIGGSGNDAVGGGDGRDNLSGGNGDDALNGGTGVDGLRTGLGDDTCANDTADRQLDSCTVDVDAPTISFPENNILEYQAGTTVVLPWTAADPSGVVLTFAMIGGPSGWVTEWCGFAIPAERTDGTSESGTYELRCDIPANAVNERYTLYVYAADGLGNTPIQWPGFEFTVLGGSSDNRVPDILEIRLPTTVSAGETFTVEVDTRDESGTAGVYSWFIGAAPYYYSSDQGGLFIPADGPAELIAGDTMDGTWRQSLTVSQSAIPGEYRLLLSIRDTVGNRGFDTTEYVVTVTDQNASE